MLHAITTQKGGSLSYHVQVKLTSWAKLDILNDKLDEMIDKDTMAIMS